MFDRSDMTAKILVLDSASVAQDVTLERYKWTLKSAVAGAVFDLPDGVWAGDRLWLKADVSGSGTCVASAAALAKLAVSQLVGLSGLTGYASVDTITAMVLDADNEQVLLEWTGTKWNVLYATTGVCTLA